MSAYKTIDQEFEDSYAEKGLQPSVGFVTPIRNVKVDRKRSSIELDRSNNNRRVTPNKNLNASKTANDNNFKAHQKNNSTQAGVKVTSMKTHKPRFTRQASGFARPQNTKGTVAQSLLSGADSLALKLKISAITQSIVAWGGVLWFVQLFFALISLVMLGAVSAFEELTKEGTILALVAKFADGLLAGIEKVFGVNLNIMEMASDLYMVSSGVVFVIGLITLLGAFFQYIFSDIKPLSGQAAGLKIGLFILAMAGYLFPFLNLFPCALPWVLAVWKYPK